MLLLCIAAGLCLLAMAGLLRGGFAGGRLVLTGFDGIGVLAGFVVTVIAAIAFGPINGLSLVIALMLHEAGHVVGAWLAGRETAEFRLLEALTGFRPDDIGLERDEQKFLHALMGAGLSVAPMVLAVALTVVLAEGAPAVAGFTRALALSIAVVSCVNLMPFHPLDGGRCIELAARALSPALLYLAVATAVGALVLAGYRHGALVLFLFAAAGLVAMLLRPSTGFSGPPMRPQAAGLGFFAYAAVLAAHTLGGWLVLSPG